MKPTELKTTKQLRVLVVDDDEEDFLIISNYIKKISGDYAFAIAWCGGYKEALAIVCRAEHDLYFIDYRLGPRTGLDLLQEIILFGCEAPVVLLTGAGNHEIDLQAMKAGAADYLIKSELNTEKLERSIRYAVARHESLKAVQFNEHKYRSIFEKTKDFIFTADETLLFTEVNQVSASLFGYAPAEMLHLRLYDLMADKRDAVFISEQLRSGNEIKDKVFEFLSKDKRLISSIISASAEKDAAGRVYVQGIIHDITGIKNAEQSALQTAKLKAAERLVRTLAHEVRNPLNNIILAVENLVSPPQDKQKVFTDIILRNSNRIDNLITELLNSSRPAVLSLAPTSLHSVLEKSIGAAMDRIVLKGINLQQHHAGGDAWIMGDPEKLSIAFLNIIINGVEACPADGAKMEIGLKEERQNYIVTITDNGYGISEENLGRIFEPYYTSKPGGMGLGLSSAINIFESHNALVQVKSVVGSGTSFTIIFNKQ